MRNFIESSTYQVRVTNFEKSIDWYEKLLDCSADFFGGKEFFEWELYPGTWLQVAKGNPGKNSGPLRFGVKNIIVERNRLISLLETNISEIEKGPAAAWCNFNDPDGNMFGLFQDLKKDPL